MSTGMPTCRLSIAVWDAKVDKNPNTILIQNKIKSRLAAAKK